MEDPGIFAIFSHSGQAFPESEIGRGVRLPGAVRLIDVLPTLLEYLDMAIPKHIQGKSLWAQITGSDTEARAVFAEHRRDGAYSLRAGDWKLIRRFKENPKYYEGLVELYNLKDDLGETKNLAKEMPEKVAELGKLIDQHFAQTGGLYPRPNPAYNQK